MKKSSFAEKLASLRLVGETQQSMAERIGLNRNTLAQYLSQKNEKPASVDVIKLICEKCNVSADWLLGLSETKKIDADLRAAIEYTKLSEKAIENLSAFNCNSDKDRTGLDIVLNDEHAFFNFYAYVCNFMDAREANRSFKGERPKIPRQTDNHCIVLDPYEAAQYYAKCIGETISQVFLDLL